MADYSTSIEIDAPPEVVFAHLVTPEGMVAWMGEHAELEPTPGGGFAVDINGTVVRGVYLEVAPPYRVVVSWGMAGSDELPPGASQVEFTLTAIATGTRLDLVHRNLPTSHRDAHAEGWTHYLTRLQTTGGGGDPGPDTWAPATRSGRAAEGSTTPPVRSPAPGSAGVPGPADRSGCR